MTGFTNILDAYTVLPYILLRWTWVTFIILTFHFAIRGSTTVTMVDKWIKCIKSHIWSESTFSSLCSQHTRLLCSQRLHNKRQSYCDTEKGCELQMTLPLNILIRNKPRWFGWRYSPSASFSRLLSSWLDSRRKGHWANKSEIVRKERRFVLRGQSTKLIAKFQRSLSRSHLGSPSTDSVQRE